MNNLLAAEALKLRTLLLPRLVLLLAVILSGVIGFAGVRIAADTGDRVTLSDAARGAAQPMWFLAVLVAVLATAGEFQHRTIRTTLLQNPRRGQVLAAKAAVAAGYGALLTVLGCLTAITAAAITLRAEALPATVTTHTWGTLTSGVLIGALWALLAVGLGVLLRNSAIALVAVLLWKFVAEQVIPIVTSTPAAQRWLPSGAADAVLYDGGGPTLLEPLAGGLVFTAYTAAILAVGGLLFARRDPS